MNGSALWNYFEVRIKGGNSQIMGILNSNLEPISSYFRFRWIDFSIILEIVLLHFFDANWQVNFRDLSFFIEGQISCNFHFLISPGFLFWYFVNQAEGNFLTLAEVVTNRRDD